MDIHVLPQSICTSKTFTNTHLQQLASVTNIPIIDTTFNDDRLKNIIQYYAINPTEMEQELHLYAKELLDLNNVEGAWQVLLVGENV